MAEGEEIILPIDVDPKDALDGLKEFEGASTGAGAVFKGVLGAEAVKAIVSGAGKALSAFAGYFGAGITAASEQEEALRALETQLGLVGGASQVSLSDFEAFADEIERTTLIAGDAVLSQIALAKTFDLTDAEAKKLVKAATELSAVTGMSLESAVKNLGKTYGGLAGELGESLPLVRNMTKEQLASGEAIDAVLERFGGTAAANIDDYAGRLGQAALASEKLSEAFGETIVQSPQVAEAFTVFTELLTYLEALVKENQDTIVEWIQYGLVAAGTAMSVAVDVTKVFVQGLNALVTMGGYVLQGMTELVSFFVDLWEPAISGAGTAVLSLLEATGAVEEGTVEAFQGMLAGVKSSLSEVSDSIGGFADDGISRAVDIETFFGKVGGAVDGAVDRVLAAEKRQTTSTRGMADAHEKAGVRIEKSAADMAKAIEDAAKLEAEITKAQETDLEKAARVRDEFAARIKEQLERGNIDQAKAAELSVQIERDYQATLAAIRAESDAASIKQAEDAVSKQTKVVEDARSRIETIAGDPVTFVVKVAIDGGDVSLEDAIAAGVGGLNQILSGADIGNGVIKASEEGARNIEAAEKLAEQNIAYSEEEAKKLLDKTAAENEKAIAEAEAEAKKFLGDFASKAEKTLADAEIAARQDVHKASEEARLLVDKAIATGDPKKIEAARERAAEIETRAREEAEEKLADLRKKLAEAEVEAKVKTDEKLADLAKRASEDEVAAKEAATQAELDAKLKAEADIAKAKEEKAKAEREAQEAIDEQGRANMTKALAAGGAAAANAFLPGIGPAVGPLIEALAAGPDAVKPMIKAFVEAAPEVVTAIAESIPVVTEVLIEELVEKGGAIRIAVAIVKGLIQATIGSNVAISHAIFGNLADFLGPAFADGGKKVADGISMGARNLFKLGGVITGSFQQAGQQLVFAIASGAQEMFKVGDAIVGGFNNVYEPIKNALWNAFNQVLFVDNAILNAALNAFNSVQIPVPEAFESFTDGVRKLFRTPDWINELWNIMDYFVQIADFIGGLIPSGGGGGFLGTGIGAASGITSVPAGFPNDSFGPVNLQSYERVVGAEQNTDLTAFLSDYNRGKLETEAETGGFDREALQVLRDIAELLARSDGRPVVVQMDKRELARGNLGNSRLNARTA